jgi:ATP synthase protein I
MPRLSTLAGGGLEFAGAILIGLFGGQWLDRRLGTGPWLVVIGVFVGAAAGFVSLYRALTRGQSRSSSRGAGPGTGA